jgi:hypothetical protein
MQVVGNAQPQIMKELNLENDLTLEIQKLAKQIGFKISFNQDFEKIVLDYLTVRTKLIDEKNRKVLVSQALIIEIFTGEKKNEINHIIKLAQNSGNLNMFLSKRVLQTNFHDHLQNEWKIFHFHLSLQKDKKSNFVKQVNSLLFAYVDDNHIAFLGTDTHKEGIFGDMKWVEILHDNFPEIIESYKDKSDIVDIYPKVNSVERQQLWNYGYTLGMTKIRNTIYQNPGIGRTTSGHSMEVSSTTIDIMRWINELNKQLSESKNELCKYLNLDSENVEFKIRINKRLELYEKTSNLFILKFPEILISKEEMVSRLK